MRVLLTGISGGLGWNMAQALRAKGVQLLGISRTNRAHLGQTFDLTNYEQLERSVRTFSPQLILHFAANSKLASVKEDPDKAHATNVGVSEVLARLAKQSEIKFLYTSTDLVFDGENATYGVSSACRPKNTYGVQKRLAEERIALENNHAVILRMPLMYGDPGPFAQNFTFDLIKKLQQKQVVALFTDEYRTPISFSCAVKGIWQAASTWPAGTYHLGGRERLSRYDMGKLIAAVLGVPVSLCQQASVAAKPEFSDRARDVSLDSRESYRRGFAPRSFQEAIQDLLQGTESFSL